MQKLTPNFLIELFKGCITSPTILSMVYDYLEYHYLPTPAHKEVWKAIKTQFEITKKSTTLGILNETLKSNQECLDIIAKMSQTIITDKKENIAIMFETYLKKTMFVDLHQRTAELYNQGKDEEAIKMMASESEAINNFSIKDKVYTTVFGGFDDRLLKRQKVQNQEDQYSAKIPFGIDSIDHDTRGGGKRGTSGLILARSGGGKSTFLRWTGLHNARIGNRVVHFQAEGTEDDCLSGYDSAWTSISLDDIDLGVLPLEKEIKIKRVHKDIIRGGGEVIVIASEQFDSMYIEDCREAIIEIEKTIGKVDVALFDYLEIFNTRGRYGNTESAERKRREDVANKITNIATELKLFSLTATQANDIKEIKWNSPEYVMTRSDIAEFKGCVKPFAYFLTLNQTKDEYENNVMRIYEEKFRFHKYGRTRYIKQALDIGRFYDSAATIKNFWDEKNKKSKS